MVGVETDADALADGVIVVRRHQRQHLAAAVQPQRVDEVAAAEDLARNGGGERAGFDSRTTMTKTGGWPWKHPNRLVSYRTCRMGLLICLGRRSRFFRVWR